MYAFTIFFVVAFFAFVRLLGPFPKKGGEPVRHERVRRGRACERERGEEERRRREAERPRPHPEQDPGHRSVPRRPHHPRTAGPWRHH